MELYQMSAVLRCFILCKMYIIDEKVDLSFLCAIPFYSTNGVKFAVSPLKIHTVVRCFYSSAKAEITADGIMTTCSNICHEMFDVLFSSVQVVCGHSMP